jgi:organic radical activating enzyme
MKWTNKGHQFDELGCIFKKNSRIVIIGSELENTIVSKKLAFLNTTVEYALEFDCAKNIFEKIIGRLKRIGGGGGGNVYIAKNFKKFYKINQFDKNDRTVLINFSSKNARHIMEQFLGFEKPKYKRDVNIFFIHDFLDKYLSIFSVYTCNKVYSKHNCFIITTICNLNCEFCLNFAPYIKKQGHEDIKKLKKNIDVYFSCIDNVGLFHLSGGEPFLYPDLIEIITYIHNNFNDKIETIGITTNGAVLPSDELCKILKEFEILVYLDNYTEVVPRIKKTYQDVLSKFAKYNIDLIKNDEISFFKIFPPTRECCISNKTELQQKFNKCTEYNGFQQVKNEKLYSCCYSSFAQTAGLIPESSDDFFDLSDFTGNIENKKILTEFRLGYNNNGYTVFCKYCNGMPNVNPLPKSKGGIQAEGHIDWDINNPTFFEEYGNINE